MNGHTLYHSGSQRVKSPWAVNLASRGKKNLSVDRFNYVLCGEVNSKGNIK